MYTKGDTVSGKIRTTLIFTKRTASGVSVFCFLREPRTEATCVLCEERSTMLSYLLFTFILHKVLVCQYYPEIIEVNSEWQLQWTATIESLSQLPQLHFLIKYLFRKYSLNIQKRYLGSLYIAMSNYDIEEIC